MYSCIFQFIKNSHYFSFQEKIFCVCLTISLTLSHWWPTNFKHYIWFISRCIRIFKSLLHYLMPKFLSERLNLLDSQLFGLTWIVKYWQMCQHLYRLLFCSIIFYLPLSHFMLYRTKNFIHVVRKKFWYFSNYRSEKIPW